MLVPHLGYGSGHARGDHRVQGLLQRGTVPVRGRGAGRGRRWDDGRCGEQCGDEGTGRAEHGGFSRSVDVFINLGGGAPLRIMIKEDADGGVP
ncbi:hypothetical protein GCM10010359_34590 [Streptomyces morookaense]|nr:hypothetical protein GCM10010359_34590 [Streptomyces morookaense]